MPICSAAKFLVLAVQVVPGFRVRTIPVMGALPALFGLVMASHVVTSLARLPVAPEPVLRLGREHYGLLHRRLIEREEVSAPRDRSPLAAPALLQQKVDARGGSTRSQ